MARQGRGNGERALPRLPLPWSRTDGKATPRALRPPRLFFREPALWTRPKERPGCLPSHGRAVAWATRPARARVRCLCAYHLAACGRVMCAHQYHPSLLCSAWVGCALLCSSHRSDVQICGRQVTRHLSWLCFWYFQAAWFPETPTQTNAVGCSCSLARQNVKLVGLFNHEIYFYNKYSL
jgi:hypothetical protein